MLHPAEQKEIVRLAKKMGSELSALRTKYKSGTISRRMLAEGQARAEARFADHLKEVG